VGSGGRINGWTASYNVVSNNFALDTMIVGDVTDTTLHGVSKTDAQLRMQSTYSGAVNGDGLGGLGWKFGNDDDNPWIMPSDGGYYYPIFYWQQ